MVAPIDAKATFEAEGEVFTLRLNFRVLALAKKEGVNLLSGVEMDAVSVAVAVRCLAAQDHPDMTDDDAFAIVVRNGEAVGAAMTTLFTEFGGSAGGNAVKPKAKRT